MASLKTTTFIQCHHITKTIIKRSSNYYNINLSYRWFSSSIQTNTEDINLEYQLDSLEIDDIQLAESLLTNEKLENIFSKIRQSTQQKQETKMLNFNDLFQKNICKQQQEEEEMIEISSIIDQKEEIEIEEQEEDINDSNSIQFMTEDDLESIQHTTAVTQQLLSENNNNINNFGNNLYSLLLYYPSGIMENDLSLIYFKHFGIEYPFKTQSGMIKYILSCLTHLFVINHDAFGRKILFNRQNILNEKYLNIDILSELKQKQLIHSLITRNQNQLLPSHRIPFHYYQSTYLHQTTLNNLNNSLLKLSELQNEFRKQFNGLFISNNLYSIVNNIDSIRKISCSIGDTTDYYLMWSSVQEDLSGMNILFKIWFILTQYPNGLRWDQLYQCYSNQFGEILWFNPTNIHKRAYWRYFISVEKADSNSKYIYKIASPELSDGCLILLQIERDKAGSTFIYNMIMKYFEITKKQLSTYLLDVLPLQNATVIDNTWKYVLCFTNPIYARKFYQKYNNSNTFNADNDQNINLEILPTKVSKYSVSKLKTFLDSIIPCSLPFSLTMTPDTQYMKSTSTDAHFGSPLPFELPILSQEEEPIKVEYKYKSVLNDYINKNKTDKIITSTSSKQTSSSTYINPKELENLWGLLTHYPDGLTVDQITFLSNRAKTKTLGAGAYSNNMLTSQQIKDILTIKYPWFTSIKLPNGDIRYHNKSLIHLQNTTILLNPSSFVLYEDLEDYIDHLSLDGIIDKTRARSNLLIHFKDKISANKLLNKYDLICKDVPIEIDYFSPSYTYNDIVSDKIKTQYRWNANLNKILQELLSREALKCNELFNILKSSQILKEKEFNSVNDLIRLIMDSYSPFISVRGIELAHSNSFSYDNILFELNLHSFHRMPQSLSNRRVTHNKKNCAYYDDLNEFFNEYSNGILLSLFIQKFYKKYSYIPGVPSLTQFLKSINVYAIKINDVNPDLYLLPMNRYNNNNNMLKYPLNGIVLEGLPDNTTILSLQKAMEESLGKCYLLRRGIDRFVVWYNSENVANTAKESFSTPEIVGEGLKIVNDLTYLRNHLLSYANLDRVY